jgi:hypothetical protein
LGVMAMVRRRVFAVGALLAICAFLCFEFIGFMEVDGCLDADGMFDYAAHRCVGATHDVLPIRDAPWTYWAFVLAVPAVPAGIAAVIIQRWLHRNV